MQIPTSVQSRFGPRFGRGGLSGMWHGDRLIVSFNTEYLKQTLFPELCSRHINPEHKSEYDVIVTGGPNVPGKMGPILFQSNPNSNAQTSDAQAPIFALRHFPELTSLFPMTNQPTEGRGKHRSSHFPRYFGMAKDVERGQWLVQVSHSAGSLESAVQLTRWRNLFFNLGALLVLGLSIGLIIRSSQRAKRLANQQLEFVAGISHELLTPLSAIQSAAQNLADGLVTNPDKIRNYGSVINEQGRRLTDMVENALDFAGIHSERKTYAFRPLVVADLVQEVVADCRPILEKHHADVTLHMAKELPPIRGDLSSSKQILHNLVTNAAKYGGEKPKITISGSFHAQAQEVHLIIEDEGPGIPNDEIPFLFEPFFRGQSARASQIQGSGLGLCLVKNMISAHDGRVSVRNKAKGGCAFTVAWPIFSPDDQPEESKNSQAVEHSFK